MKLHLNKGDGILLVHSCLEDRITIGEQTYHSSLIVSPNRLIDDWHPRGPEDLRASDFELVLTLEPEVVLLGTGKGLSFPDPAVTRPLVERSVGIEVMDTGAACRTYNVLAHEGRKVVASLIIAGP